MFVALAFLASPAYATVVNRALEPAALAVLSDAAVFGDVKDVRTTWEGGMIWTVATLELADLDAEADVWIPGGCVGDVCLTVGGAPWLAEGERVFVFLREGQPTSLAQGVFHVEGEVGSRDTSGLSFRDGVHPVDIVPVAELKTAGRKVRPLTRQE